MRWWHVRATRNWMMPDVQVWDGEIGGYSLKRLAWDWIWHVSGITFVCFLRSLKMVDVIWHALVTGQMESKKMKNEIELCCAWYDMIWWKEGKWELEVDDFANNGWIMTVNSCVGHNSISKCFPANPRCSSSSLYTKSNTSPSYQNFRKEKIYELLLEIKYRAEEKSNYVFTYSIP